MKEKESDVLVGMKAICQALNGVSEDTVLKWHRGSGLPIKKKGGVWIGSRLRIETWWREEFAK
ncbi:MAG: hypothetical protein HS130_00935 [Deltaproteobacteria bacterium]|nr:hypothetical protein [Deltaproteobacteria bacterium]MCL4873848.1 hypothetical protein [bacterium]